MISRFLRVFAAALFLSTGLQAAAQQHLTLAGSSTVQPIMEIAAQAYEDRHPGVRIDVQGGGSAVGISAPQRGIADLGMVSRSLKEGERSKLRATVIARDGVSLIVHATNPLENITRQQVRDIFSGALNNWQSLTGEDRPITVINKEEGRATREMFEEHFDMKGKFLPSAVIIGPNGQSIATVAGNKGAIAYVSIGAASIAEQDGVSIHRVSLEGVAPSLENVSQGAYRVTRSLILTSAREPQGLAKMFLDYVLSPAGQEVVRQQNFIPIAQP